jgi:hypothetical protein
MHPHLGSAAENPLEVCFFFLFICAYNVWVLSRSFPLPPPLPSRSFPYPPIPSLPGRNYFALNSSFVEERV